ncbi:MAG: hypothetical protein ACRDRT_09300, partial [Pseudonocardiaceae bacterium]
DPAQTEVFRIRRIRFASPDMRRSSITVPRYVGMQLARISETLETAYAALSADILGDDRRGLS